MKHKTLFNLLMVLGFLLVLVGGIVVTRRAQAQETGPLIPQDSVTTAFTYQGRLLDNDAPVNATCDFRFNLYDDAWFSPSLVAGPMDRAAVEVSDGYFSTVIDFGASAFNGEGRQLQILVRCPAGSGEYTTLTGMVTLNAVPYAHSLRPGANISSDTAGGLGAVLHVEDMYGGGFASAAFEGQSTQGVGVHGESGSGYGVYGEATVTGGVGVYGAAPTTGTVGIATSGGSGIGLYGKGNYAGVYSDGDAYVTGSTQISENAVVLGDAYLNGDTSVGGNLTWADKTGYLSVSTAAFQPYSNDLYFNSGSELIPGTADYHSFYAPVQLPQGATVTKMTFFWYDPLDPQDAECTLFRNNMDGTKNWMADVFSTDSAGNGSSYDDEIDYATIDNSQYAYYLRWTLRYDEGSLDETVGHGVIIEYTFTEPY